MNLITKRVCCGLWWLCVLWLDWFVSANTVWKNRKKRASDIVRCSNRKCSRILMSILQRIIVDNNMHEIKKKEYRIFSIFVRRNVTKNFYLKKMPFITIHLRVAIWIAVCLFECINITSNLLQIWQLFNKKSKHNKQNLISRLSFLMLWLCYFLMGIVR